MRKFWKPETGNLKPETIVTIKRERMEDEAYVRCFAVPERHPLLVGIGELLNRLETAVMEDMSLSPEQKVMQWETVQEVRKQLFTQQLLAQRQAEREAKRAEAAR